VYIIVLNLSLIDLKRDVTLDLVFSLLLSVDGGRTKVNFRFFIIVTKEVIGGTIVAIEVIITAAFLLSVDKGASDNASGSGRSIYSVSTLGSCNGSSSSYRSRYYG
jgi:hypothetical protein